MAKASRETVEFFSLDEIKRILLSFMTGRGERGCTEDEFKTVLGWCNQARITATMLKGILNGTFLIGLDGGEVTVMNARNSAQPIRQRSR